VYFALEDDLDGVFAGVFLGGFDAEVVLPVIDFNSFSIDALNDPHRPSARKHAKGRFHVYQRHVTRQTKRGITIKCDSSFL